MTWILTPPPPHRGHQPPPNFCLQRRCSGSLERSAREGRLLPRARIPWILIKEVFWLVRETSAVVVKAASDFMRFFSPSFWPQRGGNVATATFVAALLLANEIIFEEDKLGVINGSVCLPVPEGLGRADAPFPGFSPPQMCCTRGLFSQQRSQRRVRLKTHLYRVR